MEELIEEYNSSVIHDLKSEVTSLRTQLAKANERVKELEKESTAFRSILDQPNKHHPDTDKMYALGFNHAMRLFEDIYLGEHHHALNKFAIDKKIEALDSLEFGWLCSSDYNKLDTHIDELKNQLRKEQE